MSGLNETPPPSGTALIPLSQGAFAVVDAADCLDLIAAGPWHVTKCGRKLYAARSGGQYMHQFLTGHSMTDHANGMTLDNRRANMREATHSQNNANRVAVNNTSGYRGVHYHKPSGRWHAQITKDRRTYSLRYHPTPEDAARAWDAAAVVLHGDFAVLNFPAEDPDLRLVSGLPFMHGGQA